MMGRTATFGDLFGFLVSDLDPKSTSMLRLQLLTELRVEVQQQLAALVLGRRGQIRSFKAWHQTLTGHINWSLV